MSGTTGGNSRVYSRSKTIRSSGRPWRDLEYRWLALGGQSVSWPLKSDGERTSGPGINRCRKNLFILAVMPLDPETRGGSSLRAHILPIRSGVVREGSIRGWMKTRERRRHHQHRGRVVSAPAAFLPANAPVEAISATTAQRICPRPPLPTTRWRQYVSVK